MTSIGTTSQNTVNSWKMLRAMVGIGILCAFSIVMTFELTLERIEYNKAQALEKAIYRVIPGMVNKQTFRVTEDGTFEPVSEEEAEGQLIYAGYNEQGKLAGLAVQASGMGFADILRILYGYDPSSQSIVGFYVLESKETPGLGDKIEKDPEFLANFNSLDVSLDDEGMIANPVTTVKSGAKDQPWEIDGITGATISSRAIGDIIGRSTQKWIPLLKQHNDIFLSNKQ